MIIHPANWRQIGQRVSLDDIDSALRDVIKDIDCSSLSLSGGVDSSLLLYYLLESGRRVRTFTVANSPDHPDIAYASKVIEYFERQYASHIEQAVFIRPGLEGNALVRAFYSCLEGRGVKTIIAGDCIDELACGYYTHQDLTESTYWRHLDRLQPDHLVPLDDNSGGIGVYIPFADDRISNLFYRIPLSEKVNNEDRKLIVKALANGKVPNDIIERRKYGLATSFKGDNNAIT